MKSPVGRWFLSLRPYSFTASLIPVLLALPASLLREGYVLRWTVPVYTLAAVLFQSGTNVLNDYYDHLHGVDGPDDPDPTHAISRGYVTPRFMLLSGHLYFLLATGLGLIIAFAARRGPFFLAAGLAGALGAYLYTGRRISLKYLALGDLLVFLLMGPALVFLGVRAFSGVYRTYVLFLSLPPALLVTAILHGNNLRDMESDRAAGVRTLAGLMGPAAARRLFASLIALAYGTVPVLVATRVIPLTGVIAFLSAPLAVRLAGRVVATGDERLHTLVDLPRQTAKLHFLFSVLYIGGIALGPLAGLAW